VSLTLELSGGAAVRLERDVRPPSLSYTLKGKIRSEPAQAEYKATMATLMKRPRRCLVPLRLERTAGKASAASEAKERRSNTDPHHRITLSEPEI
jgi:hypothetical protein